MHVKMGVINLTAPFVSVLLTLAGSFLYYGAHEGLPPIPQHPVQQDYDFIVVGAGSAGSVVASRLAQAGYSVLVLEAGAPPPVAASVPGLAPLLLGESYDWNYATVPQRSGLGGFKKNSYKLSAGKTLGGTSSINWLMYVRGNRRDFDQWETMGNTGWGYEDVLKYFLKAENYQGTRHLDSDSNYGKGGPLTLEDLPYLSPVSQGILEAGIELGYNVGNPNGKEQIGFAVPVVTTESGYRTSTADAYLHPSSFYYVNKLHVLTNAHVVKVLFNDEKRAIGVAYEHKGKLTTVAARSEVILSAGAIGSPKILMLSGVGPAYHLAFHGIPIMHDLPGVGSNFHDHVSVSGLTWTTRKGTSYSLKSLTKPSVLLDFKKKRQGPLTTAFGIEVFAWTESEGDQPLWPDLQHLFSTFTLALDYGWKAALVAGYRPEIYGPYFANVMGKEGYSAYPELLRPKSRGTVRLTSTDYKQPPRVDPNYLSHPDDILTLLKGIKFVLQVGNTTVMRENFDALFNSKPLPGCDHLEPFSDDYWICYIRHMATTGYHIAGSCKMGPETDTFAVVDPSLKVYGVSGLRVVDASIMPAVTSGNTNAPTIMIGEKAADMITEEWNGKVLLSLQQFLNATIPASIDALVE
ncbi:glucose dehydrogenase [FAD, quinone]-like isoform X2 [Eriocheir sinensis]|uniref:glucose dehydrogenase [FAD, quinone]-like isoform X2 n=1 Tax=Eriocheir sinensis TaxID=95602 RepID=UPI0021CA0E22|nr:glucose dehydrogenase [FAD, quinone]-like isoform X2 [Eriocheir sinensis]